MLADRSFLRALNLDIGDTVIFGYRLTTSEFRIVGEIDQGALSFQPTLYVLRSTWQTLRYGSSSLEQPAASVVLLKGSGLPGKSWDGFTVVSKSTAFNNIEGVSAQNSTVNALMAFGYIIGRSSSASSSTSSPYRRSDRLASSRPSARARSMWPDRSSCRCSPWRLAVL